jgi:hypothetical protein
MKFVTLAVFVFAISLLTGCGKPGRYQIAGTSNQIYKIDTTNGQVWVYSVILGPNGSAQWSRLSTKVSESGPLD